MTTHPRAYDLYRKIMSATASAPYFANIHDVHAAKISANQHGVRYSFADGSALFVSRKKKDGLNEIRCWNCAGIWVAHGSKATPIEPRAKNLFGCSVD